MRLKTLFPAGACLGTNERGKRCGIRDVYENGRCQFHGGAGKLLRVERLIERARKRSKKFDRRLKRSMSPEGRKLFEELQARYGRKTTDAQRQGLRSDEQAGDSLPVQDAVQGEPL